MSLITIISNLLSRGQRSIYESNIGNNPPNLSLMQENIRIDLHYVTYISYPRRSTYHVRNESK